MSSEQCTLLPNGFTSDLVLGLETSCDETAASVVYQGREICSNIVASQIQSHQLYGGVVPEIASRQHILQVNQVIDQALKQADVALSDLSGIAVTCGPGLVGALLVGVSTAKALSYAAGLPCVGVNHLEGHIMANLLYGKTPVRGRGAIISRDSDKEIMLPALTLLVSGGHTELIMWHEGDVFERLGSSRDDAAGEALDKIARVLGLGYPGGPALEKAALAGNPEALSLPAIALEGSLDFSFSGLKTAAVNLLHKARQREEPLPVEDVAASFQAAVIKTLAAKTEQALIGSNCQTLFVAGGVAANKSLRNSLQEVAKRHGVSLHIPDPLLCTDNAAMIAAAGSRRLNRGQRSPLSLNAWPGLKLGEGDDMLYEAR